MARVISSGVWRSTIIPLSRLALFSRSSVSSSTKAFLLKNLNGITSMVLILVALFLSNATTLILIFKVAHEGSLLLDTAILPALNRSVVFHQTDQVRASLEEALDKWSVLESFVDRDTLEKYPGLSNLTVKQLYNGLVTSLDIGSSFAKRGGQGSGGSYGVCHHVGVSKTHLYFPFNICLHLPSHLDECKTFPNLYSTSFTLITNPLLSTSTAAAAETNLQSTATSLKEYPITSSLLQNFKSWKFQSVIELAGPSFNEIKSVLLSNNITTSFGVVVVNGGGGGPGNKDNKTSSFTNPDHLDVLRALSSATALGASYLFNWSVNVFIFSVNTLMNAFDLVFKATLFFAALYAFLVDDKGMMI